MRRCFVVLTALLVVVAGFLSPPASAEGTPIGNIGDTLRVNFKGIVADVTVHDVLPVDPPPPGYVATGSPRWINQGGPWKALVTVHTIQAPTPFATAKEFAFDGVTPVVDPTSYVHPSAVLIGDVIVGPHCYIGPAACLRELLLSVEQGASSCPA